MHYEFLVETEQDVVPPSQCARKMYQVNEVRVNGEALTRCMSYYSSDAFQRLSDKVA
jgi:hypothetical protein